MMSLPCHSERILARERSDGAICGRCPVDQIYDGAEADAVDTVRSIFGDRKLAVGDLESGMRIGKRAGCFSVPLGTVPCEMDGAGLGHKKTPASQGKHGVSKSFMRVRAEGLEPSTQGLKVLCSTD
jgi:hypothetical protein